MYESSFLPNPGVVLRASGPVQAQLPLDRLLRFLTRTPPSDQLDLVHLATYNAQRKQRQPSNKPPCKLVLFASIKQTRQEKRKEVRQHKCPQVGPPQPPGEGHCLN